MATTRRTGKGTGKAKGKAPAARPRKAGTKRAPARKPPARKLGPNVEALARGLYAELDAALRSGNLGLLDAVIADDAIDHDPMPGQPPGLAGIKAAFSSLRTPFSDVRWILDEVFVAGDRAVCRLTVDSRHTGTFQGIAATGREVRQRGIDILRFKGGKLTDRWGRFDEAGLLRQIGEGPAPSA